MKSIKLKKIVATAVAIATIVSVLPIGASASWKQNSDNTWAYTEGDGITTGWKMINGIWYKFDDVGKMQTGWINDNGTWYYTSSNGSMQSGWINDGGRWYHTDSSGGMQTGWISDNGTWYYTSYDGSMKTGWINDNGTWYYASSSGAMQTGIVEIDKKVYSLAANGAMNIGNIIVNGETYTFAQTGECIGDKAPQATKAFVGTGITTNVTSKDNSNSGKENSEVAKDDTKTSNDSKSSSSKNHHSNSHSSDSTKDISKLTIKNDDISFDYNINTNVSYDVKCEIYDEKNSIVDTVKWENPDGKNNSKCSIFITDVLGEMNTNNYIISRISSKDGNGTTIGSNKMKVLSSNKMNKDVSNINVSTKKINDNYELTLTSKENFENGTYVLYGYENDNSAYIKTVYCNGDTQALKFNGLNSKWANGGVSKLKLARIYDVKQASDGSGTCNVEFTDKFNS